MLPPKPLPKSSPFFRYKNPDEQGVLGIVSHGWMIQHVLEYNDKGYIIGAHEVILCEATVGKQVDPSIHLEAQRRLKEDKVNGIYTKKNRPE